MSGADSSDLLLYRAALWGHRPLKAGSFRNFSPLPAWLKLRPRREAKAEAPYDARRKSSRENGRNGSSGDRRRADRLLGGTTRRGTSAGGASGGRVGRAPPRARRR